MSYELSLIDLSGQLETMGLSRDDIRRWLEVCYPAQVRQVMLDFSRCTVQEQFQIGLKGARGLKPGVLKRRQEDQQAALMSKINQSRQLARDKAIATKQDFGVLESEFL